MTSQWSIKALLGLFFAMAVGSASSSSSFLDNGVIGDPKVDCMEDKVKLTFRTEKPFKGRIFVKGMVENDKCVNSYVTNTKQSVDFQLSNGACNMRRSRKLGPEQRGVEQSIVIIISFHEIFVTKIDKAYRMSCFYMEADRVVTNRFDVSQIPTTELIDTARMPQCTYTVRRGSVNGPIVTYASVGEPVFHVWVCDSDMFSMLVHNCFVDDGAGKDRKPLLDEHGCTMDGSIVNDLTYNSEANLAYSEVNVFKFADKVTTYFQCAVSTCMISEGMCKGKTPPRCGANSRRRRTIVGGRQPAPFVDEDKEGENGNSSKWLEDHTMDLNAGRITVLDLDLDDSTAAAITSASSSLASTPAAQKHIDETISTVARLMTPRQKVELNERLGALRDQYLLAEERVCLSYSIITILTCAVAFTLMVALSLIGVFLWRQKNFGAKY